MLALVASKAKQDPFSKVLGMIRDMITKLTIEVARDDEEAKRLVKAIQFGAMKTPVRLHDKVGILTLARALILILTQPEP